MVGRRARVGRGLDLVQEAPGADHGREFGLEHLECDASVMADILGQVDCRHAAGPELAFEQVALSERIGQGGALHVGHGRAFGGNGSMCIGSGRCASTGGVAVEDGGASENRTLTFFRVVFIPNKVAKDG
jgi:hypothetical protein